MELNSILVVALSLLLILFFILAFNSLVTTPNISESFTTTTEEDSVQPMIVIPTIAKYRVALDMLLASLRAAGIPSKSIILVYGMEAEESVQRHPEGYLRVNITRNLYEYNGFFGVTLINSIIPYMEENVFLLLHDTVVAFGAFKERVASMLEEYRKRGDALLWLTKDGQFNICMFNMEVAKTVSARLHDQHTMEKWKAINMEVNADVDSLKKMAFSQSFVLNQDQQYRPDRDVYGNNILRKVVYVPSLDIEKYYFDVADGRNRQHPNAL
jgi:hypothetical protein